ncbi:hypothetical protein HDR61_01195 [bacterium]|nr:hypothetical protein [bacterium]
MNKFPQNMKEEIILSVPNAAVMVIGMVTLNLWIYGALSLSHFAIVASMMFVVAFLYDFFIVGPLVTRLVRKYNIMRAMPFIRVAIMAGTLTFVAPILEGGIIISGSRYLMTVPRNYIAALALQILIAFPFGLFVLGLARRYVLK